MVNNYIMSAEDLKIALEKASLKLYPYVLCCNESDAKELKDSITKNILIKEFPDQIIKKGTAYLIDRKKAENDIIVEFCSKFSEEGKNE